MRNIDKVAAVGEIVFLPVRQSRSHTTPEGEISNTGPRLVHEDQSRPVGECEFLIDRNGDLQACAPKTPRLAVWHEGYIHIHKVDAQSMIVTLQPKLVSAETLAGAFYAIADLMPLDATIAVFTGDGHREEFSERIVAFKRMETLVRSS